MNEASSPPLLFAERASPRETGLFPVHARWCLCGSLPRACTLVSSWVQEGSIEGDHATRAAGPAVRTRSAPVIRPSGQDAGPTSPVERRGPRGRRSLWISHRPSHPDLSGERVRPPDSAPYLDPSFWNTAPPSQSLQHDEGTRSLRLFWTLFPLDTFILLFYVK